MKQQQQTATSRPVRREIISGAKSRLGDFDEARYFPSLWRAVGLMVVSIFLGEVCIEYLMFRYIHLTLPRHIFAEAGLTVAVLVPIFYFVLYRPFKKLDAARKRIQHENQLLSRKLIRRDEEEKRHLARELHDNFGQVLTALQFGVATLKGSCLEADSGTHSCSYQADRLAEMIAQLGDQVRAVSINLRPAVLDALGLKAALQILVEEDWGALRILLKEEGSVRRYAPEIELALFRICQEALNNVRKHAEATQVEIHILHGEKNVRVEISDDGVGFDIDAPRAEGDRRRGLGLLGMRERVAALGGSLMMTSKAGIGTAIEVEVPAVLPRRRDEPDPDSDS